MSELKEIAAKAAEDLPGAFTWYDTPQGHAYWEEVYADLRKLAELGVCNAYAGSYVTDTQECGTAPLDHEEDRRFALELADLIDELLLFFVMPAPGENDQFDRWAKVHGNLLVLGGEGPTEEWIKAVEEDR